jgi:DNA invertase Pin-like site-specific DNA recombinase
MVPRWLALPCASHPHTKPIVGGRAKNRPHLQAALAYVCKLKGTLVVYSLDRLARNVGDARAISKRLEKADANLAILQMRVDTTTPYGRLPIHQRTRTLHRVHSAIK